MPKPLPIGRILVQQGIITEEQCQQILDTQARTYRPFGEIAEDVYDIGSRAIERAWSEQYAATTLWIDPNTEPSDPTVREYISRRQAWQFKILPVRMDGSEVMICTTKEHLVRAMNFAVRHFPRASYFVLAHPEQLADALMHHYPMEGMSRETLEPSHLHHA